MRNVPCALAFVVLLCSGLAISQNTPSWELSGGYQFTRADIGAVQDLADRLTVPVGLPRIDVGRKLNMSGGNAAIENNVNSWVGGVFDFGGAYGDKHIDLSTVAQVRVLYHRVHMYKPSSGPPSSRTRVDLNSTTANTSTSSHLPEFLQAQHTRT